jgi:hypothetical protein
MQKTTGLQVEDVITSGLDSDRGGDVDYLVPGTLGSRQLTPSQLALTAPTVMTAKMSRP